MGWDLPWCSSYGSEFTDDRLRRHDEYEPGQVSNL
jgi:predicted dithiol-disulfide oxidoreductase (DUF899 family)